MWKQMPREPNEMEKQWVRETGCITEQDGESVRYIQWKNKQKKSLEQHEY